MQNEPKEFYLFMARSPGVKEWHLSAEAVTGHPDQDLLMQGVDAIRVREVTGHEQVMIEALRRILAVARMVNNQRPDERMNHALKEWDSLPMGNGVKNG